jgi:sodium-dependent phosphate cotransporter
VTNAEKRDLALRFLKLIILVYLFLISLELLKNGFKLFGQDFSKTLVEATSNPIVGLCIGLLATSLAQSSSSTTSILVSMVAAGTLNLHVAIPMVMGANIGTSVTSMLVATAHITRRNEFGRAFTAATVHDTFNLLAVALLLPLEVCTGFLEKSATALQGMLEGVGGLQAMKPVEIVVAPVADRIQGAVLCLFADGSGWQIAALMIVALILMFIALKFLVDTLKAVMVGPLERLIHGYLFKTTPRALLFGLAVTVCVQSSSITISLMVPLVASGILTVHHAFPYAVGANIGTTVTALLAALYFGKPEGIALALTHTLFNVSGGAIFLPLRVIPISIAEYIGRCVEKYRILSIVFIAMVFFIIPLGVIVLFS